MSITLYYFTGTGNSLFLAKEFAKELDSLNPIAIKDVISEKEIVCSSDVIGIIFPVYYYGLPVIVSDFIKRLKLKNSHYCFGIAVHGGEKGNALHQLRNECRSVGLDLQYANDLETCGSYIVLYKPPKPEAFTYGSELQRKVKSIANAVSSRTVEIGDIKFRPILRFIYFVSFKRWLKADKNFICENKCKGCGVCEKVCPVHNIVLANNRPSWRHNCIHCMTCIHWCPCDSIQYRKCTVGRNRYKNPFISLDEMESGNHVR